MCSEDTTTKRILAVGIQRGGIDRVSPQLRRNGIEVLYASSALEALALCRERRFDLILAGYPAAGLSLDRLLDQIRRPGSACSEAVLLVVTDPEKVKRLENLTDEHFRVLSHTNARVVIKTIISKVLGIAPRMSARFMVKFKVELERGEALRVCQSENLSETGMRVRTSEVIPVGSRLSLQFSLPPAGKPLYAEAEVVRHMDPREASGLGLKFQKLEGGSATRLRDYLEAARRAQDKLDLMMRQAG